MGEFHLKGDLPQDREGSIKGKAAAFDAAFSHARTDPAMRLQMLLAETTLEFDEVVRKLAEKLKREAPQVLVKGQQLNTGQIYALARDDARGDKWEVLLTAAITLLDTLPSETQDVRNEDDPRRIEQSR